MSDSYGFEEEEFQKSMNRDTLVRIVKQLRFHKKMTIGFLISIAIVAVLEAFMTRLGGLIIDEAIIPQDVNRLFQLMGAYAVSTILLSACVFVFIALAGKLGQRVTYDLRKEMFNHLQTLSLKYYNKTPVGWIMSRVNSDSERIADLVSWGLLDITWCVLNMTTAFTFMLTINWQLTLVIMPFIPAMLYVANWFKNKILVEYRDSRRYNSKITGTYNEMITGVRVIKALNREETSMGEFGDLTRHMYTASYRAAWFSALFLPSIYVMSSIAIAIIMLVGGNGVINAVTTGMTVGGVTTFISYITFIMWPIQDLARVYAGMQHAIASAERAFSLIDAKADIIDRPQAQDLDVIKGDIVFENVTFHYDNDDTKEVLENFNLKIKVGETIALVGHTGSGKSTIVNLLCRFYEPISGRILINGRDYREYTLHSLHSKLGIVLQTPHLFRGTIRENIRYGKLDASDEQVERAGKLAGAHDFIMSFEKNYGEEVGESGVLLSTGQKQLISLARAILAEPELFIMDEATSSVDTITEELIQRGMDAVMDGRTSLVIAHRLSTIKNADRIICLDHGKIIEMGSHKELIQQGGYYHNLYTKQFRKEKAKEYGMEIRDDEPAEQLEAVGD
jgi:ATP-binding cassette, subfamily B, bacterial